MLRMLAKLCRWMTATLLLVSVALLHQGGATRELVTLQVGERSNFSVQFSDGPANFIYNFNKTVEGLVSQPASELAS